MIKIITILNGHKVAQTVQNREAFLALRNSSDNLSNLELARMGNSDAKANLVQFAYNDLMPDGKVAGCCHPSDCFFHDIDFPKPTAEWHYQDFAALVDAAVENGKL